MSESLLLHQGVPMYIVCMGVARVFGDRQKSQYVLRTSFVAEDERISSHVSIFVLRCVGLNECPQLMYTLFLHSW